MPLHTIDPTADAAEASVHALLKAHDDKPIRYEDHNGEVTNTTACRGLVAWYVLIEATHDGVTVGPVRLGLGTGARGFTTRQYLTAATRVPYPSGRDGAEDVFAAMLAVYVGLALDEIDKAQASRG